MTTWQETCEWTYITSEGVEFVPFIEGNRLKYYFTHDPDDVTDWLDIITTSLRPDYLSATYKRANPNPHNLQNKFISPLPLPPSPVILKLRQLEKHFNERKIKTASYTTNHDELEVLIFDEWITVEVD